MKLIYKPKSNLEKFGEKIYFLLVDNFPQSFYVGGMVRDLLLHKQVTDIDIATEAKPEQVIKLLTKNQVTFNAAHEKFGVIMAQSGMEKIEITTFRKDLPGKSRYPKISLINTVEQDSKRRDFTANALYFSQKSSKILDYYNGLTDIQHRLLRFIGNPAQRIKQDPLRIVRAVRFAVTLNFKFEHATDLALEKHFNLVKTVTRNRQYAELNKIKNPAQRKIAETILLRKKLLDKYE